MSALVEFAQKDERATSNDERGTMFESAQAISSHPTWPGRSVVPYRSGRGVVLEARFYVRNRDSR